MRHRALYALDLLAELGDLLVAARAHYGRYVLLAAAAAAWRTATLRCRRQRRVVVVAIAHDAALGDAQPEASVLVVHVRHLVQALEGGHRLLAEQQADAHVVGELVTLVHHEARGVVDEVLLTVVVVVVVVAFFFFFNLFVVILCLLLFCVVVACVSFVLLLLLLLLVVGHSSTSSRSRLGVVLERLAQVQRAHAELVHHVVHKSRVVEEHGGRVVEHGELLLLISSTSYSSFAIIIVVIIQPLDEQLSRAEHLHNKLITHDN